MQFCNEMPRHLSKLFDSDVNMIVTRSLSYFIITKCFENKMQRTGKPAFKNHLQPHSISTMWQLAIAYIINGLRQPLLHPCFMRNAYSQKN